MTEGNEDNMGRETPTQKENVLNAICLFRERAVQMISFGFPLLVLSLIAFPFLEPGSANRIVLVIDLVLLSTLILLAGALILVCRRREQSTGRSFDNDWP